MDEYQKICGIYDYICSHITYDYANLNDNSYQLKHTAYAALINGTAVCQGYALLLYRLSLELGFDARLISGDAGGSYLYFLRSEENFSGHTRDADYLSNEVVHAYPMTNSDYDHERGEELENPFIDVPEDAYYYEPVLWAYENGIASGISATTFGASNPCTRAQVAVFLWRAMGQPELEISSNPFADVSSSAYYYKAVLWAYENGVTSGVDATHFAPNGTVTRAQFVTFLWRVAGKPLPNVANPFSDVYSGQYYTNAILWSYENGITTGVDATHFSPGDSCTRGQMGTFLYRAMK